MTLTRISRTGAAMAFTILSATTAFPRTIPFIVNPFCFDNLKAGTTFTSGDTFEVDGARVSVQALLPRKGEDPVEGGVTVEEFSDSSSRTKAGRYVSMKTAIVELDLSEPMGVADLFYRSSGQILYLEVNGDGEVLDGLDRAPTALGGVAVESSTLESGFVRLRLIGDIRSFGIGGDQLDFDCGYRQAILPLPQFTRGDADDSGATDLTDAVVILRVLFQGGEVRCEDAADTNDDGSLDVTDPIYLLDHLFRGGPAPSAPAATPGEDPTEDSLQCAPLFQRGE